MHHGAKPLSSLVGIVFPPIRVPINFPGTVTDEKAFRLDWVCISVVRIIVILFRRIENASTSVPPIPIKLLNKIVQGKCTLGADGDATDSESLQRDRRRHLAVLKASFDNVE